MHARMEQSFIQQRNQQPGVVLGWTQQSALPSEAIEAPSQSASSAVVCPGSRNGSGAPSESSGQSSSSLKEHDYIGLAEVSSAPSLNDAERDAELNLAETDLRLGLGPASEPPITSVDKALESQRSEALDGIASRTPSLTISHKPDAPDVALHIRDDASVPQSMPSTWQSIPMKSLVDIMPISHINGFPGTALVSASKNGGKRMYAEAMVDVSRDTRSIMNVNSSSGAMNAGDPRMCANQIIPIKQFQDSDKKSHAMRTQGVFWVPPHVPSWQPQANYRSVASQNGMVYTSAAVEKDGEVSRNAKLDSSFRSDSSRVLPIANEENVPDEAPPAKGQVVGWPPVRSYRRITLATRSKPIGDEGDSQSAIYVKVNMDGIPIGRKVDLNAYKSYDGLLSALEDMFHNPNSGLGARFLKGSEFVLTYEDKEGDWMLVGDVPWGMFVNTVRRLRITRGSDLTGLGSRTSCHE